MNLHIVRGNLGQFMHNWYCTFKMFSKLSAFEVHFGYWQINKNHRHKVSHPKESSIIAENIYLNATDISTNVPGPLYHVERT